MLPSLLALPAGHGCCVQRILFRQLPLLWIVRWVRMRRFSRAAFLCRAVPYYILRRRIFYSSVSSIPWFSLLLCWALDVWTGRVFLPPWLPFWLSVYDVCAIKPVLYRAFFYGGTGLPSGHWTSLFSVCFVEPAGGWRSGGVVVERDGCRAQAADASLAAAFLRALRICLSKMDWDGCLRRCCCGWQLVDWR